MVAARAIMLKAAIVPGSGTLLIGEDITNCETRRLGSVVGVDTIGVLGVDTIGVLGVDTIGVLGVDTIGVLGVDTIGVFGVDTIGVLGVGKLGRFTKASLPPLPNA